MARQSVLCRAIALSAGPSPNREAPARRLLMKHRFTSIGIAGAWGYIGRRLLDAARRLGLQAHVHDPGPRPNDLDPDGIERTEDESAFYALNVDLFHLALHPEARRNGLRQLLDRSGSEPLLVLNEKPIAPPEAPDEARALIGDWERGQATLLFDFPELFDPLTHRIVEFLRTFSTIEWSSISLVRSKDREDPSIPRNHKKMVPIQFQESVHCLAYALHVIGHTVGSHDAALGDEIAAQARSEPYRPPNPELYPRQVDGRCEYQLKLGSITVNGLTNFKSGAPWSKRRVLTGLGDGRPFEIEADFLEGKKYLRINGQDQPWDARSDSYESILTTLATWRQTVSRAQLLNGLYPNARLAWLAYQLSGALWKSSFEGKLVTLRGVEALDEFDSGYGQALPSLPPYAKASRTPNPTGDESE